MPAIVRGGSGGKNTKDATAVPGDVRNGKTFYGANGKQTGIWTPKVTDYTGDATAVPADVKKGKVFYNSKGRQIGNVNFSNYLLEKSFVVPKINGTTTRLGTRYIPICYSAMHNDNSEYMDLERWSSGEFDVTGQKHVLNWKKITGFTLNGKRREIMFNPKIWANCGKGFRIRISESNNESGKHSSMWLIDGCLYVEANNQSTPMILHYI